MSRAGVGEDPPTSNKFCNITGSGRSLCGGVVPLQRGEALYQKNPQIKWDPSRAPDGGWGTDPTTSNKFSNITKFGAKHRQGLGAVPSHQNKFSNIS